MTLNLNTPQQMHTDFTPRITVIGVGGGGTNAVDNMIAANLRGVDFVVANTDAQQLMHSKADRRGAPRPPPTPRRRAGAGAPRGPPPAPEAAPQPSPPPAAAPHAATARVRRGRTSPG